jgi:hypothetical protein
VYSLVTPSVLAGDLVCRPCGPRLLRLLDELMLLDPSAAAGVAAEVRRTDVSARFAAWEQVHTVVATEPSLSQALDLAQSALAAGAESGQDAPAGTADVMAAVPIGGGLDPLLAFLTGEGLDLPGVAEDDSDAVRLAASDALAAAWTRVRVGDEHAAVLSRAWETARASADRWQLDRAAVLGPQARDVAVACAQLRQLDADGLDRLLVGHDGARWPEHMHAAAWAAHLSGRLRAVAVAQLQACAALSVAAGRAGWGPATLRQAVAPVVGAVTQHVLADVLESDTARELSAAMFSGLQAA